MKRLAPCLGLAIVLVLCAQSRAANPPGALDLPPSSVIPAPVDVTPTAPRAERPADPSGNPLWAIPLSALTATRERPLFLPSRRAPAPAVAGTPVVVAPPPPASAEPEQPPLTLIGAVAGDNEGFAVFLDQATGSVIRLKTGQDHSGWVLSSVKGREATLEKNRRSATLSLPAPGEAQAMPVSAPAVPPAMLPRPGPAAPARGPRPPINPHSQGVPRTPIPGDTRPLEDQL
jgi:general secretion pathway protein N